MPHVVSESRASDAALRAMADAAQVAADMENWLIVGGHMVNLHVLRAIKTFAYTGRSAPRDAEDLYRLFEVAHADGLSVDAWPRQSTFEVVARRLLVAFDSPGRGLAVAGLSPRERVRLRALVRALVGGAVEVTLSRPGAGGSR